MLTPAAVADEQVTSVLLDLSGFLFLGCWGAADLRYSGFKPHCTERLVPPTTLPDFRFPAHGCQKRAPRRTYPRGICCKACGGS